MAPRTINCHISSIRLFYNYLKDKDGISIENPVVTSLMLREFHPLPRYINDLESTTTHSTPFSFVPE